ncbi:trypsin-like peptidase domain-containing protein [Streptomyces mobaraensis]|uniref:trypsin-like peptidase domain-containing protein n=1 Tax=Streptomyces mobaraensis TaxID=35621 RepID=UPI0033F7F367
MTRDTVLTAAHALDGAAAVLARFFTDEGTPCEVPGECVWADDGTDIALLRIEVDARPGGRLDGRLAADVPPVRFGRIAQLAEVDCGALGFPWFKLRSERASLDGRAATTYRDSSSSPSRPRRLLVTSPGGLPGRGCRGRSCGATGTSSASSPHITAARGSAGSRRVGWNGGTRT